MKKLLTPFACWLLATYIRFVYFTSRKTYVGTEPLNTLFANKKSMIFTFWHGRLLMMPMFNLAPEKTYVLISHHRDGALISKTIGHFNLKTVRGSSNRKKTDEKGSKDRGGVKALKSCIEKIKSGESICITPDGPRGPAQEVQGTAVNLAKLTGAPIVPISHSQSWRKTLKTWDKFQIPLPFSRSVMMAGEPIYVDKDADEKAIEKARKSLEDQLNWQTKTVDSLAGHN